MKYFILVLIGLAGGVLAGMGMGGGTLLIPLLTVFGGMEQHAAQGINLLAFIPTALAALIIHLKNKLVKFRGVLYVMLPACACSVAASFFAVKMPGEVLKLIFGIFIALLGVAMLVSETVKFFIGKKKKSGADATGFRETPAE